MKFRFIGAHRVELDEDGKTVKIPVNAYSSKKVFHGDVVDLNDWLSSKALKNPNYELIKPEKKKKLAKKEEEQEVLPLTD